MFACARLLLGALFATATFTPVQRTDSPEPVLRALMLAMYSRDVSAFERLTVPHPLRTRFTAGARLNEAALKDLKEDPDGLQLREQREKLFKGEAAKPGPDGNFPVGTTALYRAAHRGGPMIVPLVRQADGWRVDLRWWISATEMASGPRPAAGSPEVVVKSMLLSLLRFDKSKAASYLIDPKGLEILLLGAPSQREPSGVLDATAAEMPLVEIGPGEFYPMAIGPVVEGTTDPNRKVLVGMFGPTEMPFVLVKKGADWKVAAQPYYAWMNK